MDQDNIKNLLYMTRPELRDEIHRLKAEVEALKEDNEVLQNRCDFLEGRGKE
jgi:hypothetical protein